jgi:outer membrane protein assembly factor BamD
MLKKGIYKTLFFLGTAFFIFSCSGFEKVIKSDDVDLKYSKAFYYYNNSEFVKASELFEQLAPLTRGSRRADSVYFYQAMSQYYLTDYILAGHYFGNFVDMFGNSKFVEEAAYMEAYCYYMQAPRPELDQTSTNQALDAFRLYIIRYPSSKRIPDCKRLINELNEKMMEKEFLSAQLYYNLDDYKAAVVSFSNCLIDYPDSKLREEIMYKLLRSKFMLAQNSVLSKQTERYQDAIDEYYSFVAEFPGSENRKNADAFFQEASKYVKESNTEISNNGTK